MNFFLSFWDGDRKEQKKLNWKFARPKSEPQSFWSTSQKLDRMNETHSTIRKCFLIPRMNRPISMIKNHIRETLTRQKRRKWNKQESIVPGELWGCLKSWMFLQKTLGAVEKERKLDIGYWQLDRNRTKRYLLHSTRAWSSWNYP